MGMKESHAVAPAECSGAEEKPHSPRVRSNEQLIALAGLVLLPLIAVEIASALYLRTLMPIHVFVGIVLVGPLLVKLWSTGLRFARYYLGSPDYVQAGPPLLALRLLAPLLVADTIVLVGTGIALVAVGPASAGSLVGLHNVSALVFIPVATLHVGAYIARSTRLTLAPPRRDAAQTSRGWRQNMVNIVAIAGGMVAAVLLMPLGSQWGPANTQPIPAALIVGGAAAIIAYGLTRPHRWTRPPSPPQS